MTKAAIALIGAGNISDQYLTNLTKYPDVRVVAVTDANEDAAKAQADKYSIPRFGTPDLALSDPKIDLIVNLTTPNVHYEVSAAALTAGKHVWSEKPLATNREDGRRLVELAKATGLRLGCAPDTVLCPGVQTSLRTLRTVEEDGPVFRARMLFQYHGPDFWHPNPEFLFKRGAGPLMDYGPYYLTFAVLALGPVARVAGAVGVQPRTTRDVHQGPLAGTQFSVEVPTTVVALLEHEGGGFTDVTLSFDANTLREEVEFQTPVASIIATDPNRTDGTLRVMKRNDEVTAIDPTVPTSGRGVGVVDMVRSLNDGSDHRASAELAYHVLDVMLSVQEAIDTGTPVEVKSSVPTVPLLPDQWDPLLKTV